MPFYPPFGSSPDHRRRGRIQLCEQTDDADWQFRRTAFPMVLYMAMFFASFLTKGKPWFHLVSGRFSVAHLFLTFSGCCWHSCA